MKKYVFPLYTKITFAISVILFLPYVILKFLEASDMYIYAFGTDSEAILPYLLTVLLVVFLSSATVFIIKNAKRKKFVAILSVVVCVLILSVQVFGISWSKTEPKYYEFTSENGSHNIIVKEESWLLSGFGVIYEKTSPYTMKKIGSYSADDGYRPFLENEFYFVWNEDDFDLHYNFGNSSDVYKVVKMEYVN